MTKKRIGVLVSGSGSNLQALIDSFSHSDTGEIIVVISDRREAFGLKRAAKAQIEGIYLPKKKGTSREDYDKRLADALAARDVEWIVCAGFMKILGNGFVQKWRHKIINIHPAILPSFPGTDAVAQALNAGVRVTGATVHFVDEGTDTGPIIAQSALAVSHSDSLDSLKAKVLATEHRLLPMAVKWAVEGRLSVIDGRVCIAEQCSSEATIIDPIDTGS